MYAYAALCGLNHMGLKLNNLCERVEKQDFVPMQEIERVLDDPMDLNESPEFAADPVKAVTVIKEEAPKKKSLAERMAEMNN